MAARATVNATEKREKIWIFERESPARDFLRAPPARGRRGGARPGSSPPAAGTTRRRARRLPPTPPADTGGGAAPPPPPPADPAAAASEIKTGGRLRVGHVGGGEGESFNPATGSTFIDASRFYNVYDPLIRVDPDLSIQPGLALEWTPNADSTLWQIKLRPDVVWHDGKPFTADDVIYTMQQMGDEKHIAHSSVLERRPRRA